MANEASFSVPDTVVFALSLLTSLLTGVYFAYTDRNDKSTATYFNGKGKMSAAPVGLSLSVSFVSALTVMGFPVEVYYYGTVWFWILVSFPLVVMTTSNYFIPMYYDLKLQCVYEYLELRFNKTVRLVGSMSALLYLILYLAVIVYYPALSLSTVMPISVNWAIAITLVVCSVYTVIGGFKSVVWTDTFQSSLMVAGCIALLVNLALKHGPSEVVEVIERGNRNTWNNFTLNPYIRSTPFSVFFLSYLDWLIILATTQPCVQRYVSCKSEKSAKFSLYIAMFPQSLITFLSLLMGVYLYVQYEHCDPFTNKEIISIDQILPYAVVKNTKNLPGLSGLFVATVYSSTFSSISSGLNSMVVIIMEDYVSLKWKFHREEQKLKYSKICGVIIAVLLLALAYLTTAIDSSFIQIAYTVPSAFGACIFGIFFLGMFVPWANPTGTMIGAIAGFVVSLWLSIGSLLTDIKDQSLPVSTANCTFKLLNNTIEYSVLQNTTSPEIIEEMGNSPYEISYGYFRLIAFFITVPVGIAASFVTGAEDPKVANPRLFVPLISSTIFPTKLVAFFRFGVSNKRVQEKEEEMEHFNLKS